MFGLPGSGQGWAIYEYATSCGNLVVLPPGPKAHQMPRPLRRRPKPARRRALELLVSCRDGCSEALMLIHGFTMRWGRVGEDGGRLWSAQVGTWDRGPY
jgi:hypothetical protein